MADRRAELERKKQRLAQIREEKERRKREKEGPQEVRWSRVLNPFLKDICMCWQDEKSAAKDNKTEKLRAETDLLLSSLGISPVSSQTNGLSLLHTRTLFNVYSTELAKRSDLLTLTKVSSLEVLAEQDLGSPKLAKKAPVLSVVNLQETNIPPKESVTYDKQTQTKSDREGIHSSTC